MLHWATQDYGREEVYVLATDDGAASIATFEAYWDRGGFGHDPERAMGVEIANQVMHKF